MYTKIKQWNKGRKKFPESRDINNVTGIYLILEISLGPAETQGFLPPWAS